MKVASGDTARQSVARQKPVAGKLRLVAIAAGICAGALSTRRGLHADPTITSEAKR